MLVLTSQEGIETDKTDSSRDYIFFIITGTLLG